MAWSHERIAGCPKCVQTRLWQIFWWSLPLANVFLPIVWPLIVLEIRTSQRNNRPGIPQEFADWVHLSPPAPRLPETSRAKSIRLLLVLVILAVVFAGVFLVLPRIVQ